MKKIKGNIGNIFAVGVLVVSSVLIVYIVYQITLTKQRFADKLISNSIDQTRSELKTFFNPVHQLIHTLQRQHQLRSNKNLSHQELNQQIIPIIESHSQISSAAIADTRGYEFNVLPDTNGAGWLNREVFVDRWGYTERWKRWKVTDSLREQESWEKKLLVDPRDRPWYTGAVARKGEEIFWTRPFKYTTNDEIGITASILVGDTSQAYQKILALDLTLTDLNIFVEELELTKNQNVFLLTDDNTQVIAVGDPKEIPLTLPDQTKLLLSPKELGNRELHKVIATAGNKTPFQFTFQGDTWWGIMSHYNLTNSRQINIVSVLPEKDFALGIDRTLWVIYGSFFIILILSSIIVRNHVKQNKINALLANKNKQIAEQKRVLFSEVHHRVKNNLAVISAFMQLEQIDLSEPTDKLFFNKSLKRIKVLALVQEEAYKSEHLGIVPAEHFVTKILELHTESQDFQPIVDLKEVQININQAQSYGLLINEVLIELLHNRTHGVTNLEIRGKTKQEHLHTSISLPLKHKQQKVEVLDSGIAEALLNQLDASMNFTTNGSLLCTIDFELREVKGVVGNLHYSKGSS